VIFKEEALMSDFRNLFTIYCAVIGLFGSVIWASVAWAAPIETLHGKVAFEQRYTVVQLEFCSKKESCPVSEPYWTLVLTADDQHRYELNPMFAKGAMTPPESVEIDSVIVRPGSVLELEAEVSPLTDDYSLIYRIFKLQLAMDRAENAESRAIPFYGWACDAVGTAEDVRVSVVFEAGAYTIRVVSADADREFAEAKLELKSGGSLLYVGSDGGELAELSIAAESATPVAGTRRSGRLQLAGASYVMDLSCYPTRSSTTGLT